MELQLRAPRARFHPLMRPVSRRRGMGDGTCQVPRPGVPMYYPACPGYTAAAPATTPGVFVEPTAQPALNCVDPASGLPYFTPDCVNENLRREAANQAARDAENRSVFVTNCNNDWAANKAQYEALGMPVPPNDCAFRTYGQTLPGTTGGTTAYLPSVPQEVVEWRAANPSGGVSVAWDDQSAAKLAPATAPSSSASPAVTTAVAPRATATSPAGTAAATGIEQVTSFLTGEVQLGGNAIPTWALVAGALVAAYFVFGGKK